MAVAPRTTTSPRTRSCYRVGEPMEAAEFEQRLHDAEVRLARLKSLYEQWFQGFERAEPLIARKELDRALDALRRDQPRNTALRFRFQQLVARYGTYGIHWSRTARRIEEGTLPRDLARARARVQRVSEGAREASYEIDVELDEIEEVGAGFDESDIDTILGALAPSGSSEGDASPAAPVAVAPPPSPPGVPRAVGGAPQRTASPVAPSPPRPPPPRPPAPPNRPPAVSASSGSGIDLHALFDRYVDARRKNNERVDNLRFETLKRNVEEMLPKLRAKHTGKEIDFDVVVAGGRVGLKPKVR